MPIYEYGCEAGHRFEVTQKLSDPPLATCQVCDLPVSKLISAPAISFKGSGWYVTDYSDKLKPPGSSPATSTPPSTTGTTGNGSSPAKSSDTPST